MSSSPRRTALALLTAVGVGVSLLPACVVKLQDRNSPEPNGNVSGPAANCAGAQVLPRSTETGPAGPRLVGRFATIPPEQEGGQPTYAFDWSGNYITARFGGTDRVTVKLALVGEEALQDQMFEFVVDNLPPAVRRITVKELPGGVATNTPLEEYDVVGLDKGVVHEVTVYKNTEAQKGSVVFKGIDLHGGTFLPATKRPRRIEFIGDSIMCGYGNEGKNATCPFEVKLRDARDNNGNVMIKNGVASIVSVPVTENQYLSYTSLTARELSADAVTTCWSGKGVYKNYKEKKDDPDRETTVPQLWASRTIATDSIGAAQPVAEGGSRWDFGAEPADEKPQVVVISLGTNDFSRDVEPEDKGGDNVPDGLMDRPGELDKFYQAYLELVQNVRTNRPDAHIFIAVPPMVTDQYPLDLARTKIRNTLNRIVLDMEPRGGKVYSMELVEQGFRYGLGCDYHPNLEVHRIMAKQLVGAIRSKTCWD